MSACTHGGPNANLAQGSPCPYGHHIVAVTHSVASQVTSREVAGSVSALDGHLPATIVPGVAANSDARTVPIAASSAPDTYIAASLFDVAPDVPAVQPVPAPLARTTDPAASHQAASRAAIFAESNRAKVLIAHADAGPRGLTGDELEEATKRPYESLGPRRPSLERAGLIVKVTDDLGNDVQRNKKQVYRVTIAGEHMAQQWRTESAVA